MTLFLDGKRLAENDRAAAAAQTSRLSADIAQQYAEATAPPPPSFSLPTPGQLGVSSAPSPIANAIATMPTIGRRAVEAVEPAISWTLPSLESLGVAPKPGRVSDGGSGTGEYTLDLPPEPESAALAGSGVPGMVPRGGPPGSKEEKQAEVYRQARANGLDDEAARILVAVTETEGGLFGAVGDIDRNPRGSRGPFQFYEGGQMPGFRAWLGQQGIRGDPDVLVNDIPLATRYAASTYLGRAIAAGRAAGLSGSALATYVQRHGQVSEHPERTGANYDRLFGPGAAPAPPTAGAPTPAASPPSAPAAAAAPTPPAAAGAPDEVTVRMPNSAETMRVPRSMVGEGPGKYAPSKGWTVVGDGRQAQLSALDEARASTGGGETMARQAIARPVPMPGAVDEQAQGGVPWLGESDRDPWNGGVGEAPAGGYLPTPAWPPADERRSGEMPYDATTPEGIDATNDPLMAPWAPAQAPGPGQSNPLGPGDSPGDPEVVPWPTQIYRQPLAQQPEGAGETPFDPREADQGAREGGQTAWNGSGGSGDSSTPPNPSNQGQGNGSVPTYPVASAPTGAPASDVSAGGDVNPVPTGSAGSNPDIPGPDLGPGGFPIVDQPPTYGPYTSETTAPPPSPYAPGQAESMEPAPNRFEGPTESPRMDAAIRGLTADPSGLNVAAGAAVASQVPIPGTTTYDEGVEARRKAAQRRFDEQVAAQRADRILEEANAEVDALAEEARGLIAEAPDEATQQAIIDRYTQAIDQRERRAAVEAAEARQAENRRQEEMAESATRSGQRYTPRDRMWDAAGRTEIPFTGRTLAQATGLGTNAPPGVAQSDVNRYYEGTVRNTLARPVTDIMGEGQLGEEAAPEVAEIKAIQARYGYDPEAYPPAVRERYEAAFRRANTIYDQGGRYASERAPGTEGARLAADVALSAASVPLMPGFGQAATALRTGTAAQRAGMAARLAGGVAIDPTGALLQGAIEGPVLAARGLRAAGPAVGRGARSLAEEGARQLTGLTPQTRMIQEGGGATIGRGGAVTGDVIAPPSTSAPASMREELDQALQEFDALQRRIYEDTNPGSPERRILTDQQNAVADRIDELSTAMNRGVGGPETIDAQAVPVRPALPRPSTESALGIAGPVPGPRGAGLGTQIATDVGNSVLGAGAGALAPAETPEERVRNATIGAAGFPVAGRLLRRPRGAPGIFGPVGSRAPSAAFEDVVRPRVVPPHVADELDFPIRIPEDPAVLRAIEAAGGKVDPAKGVDLHVIRQQGPDVGGGTATRGGIFYTAGPPGSASPYAVGADDPNKVGGTQRVEGWTRFRSPLILSDAPGGSDGFEQAMQQLWPTSSQAERDAAQAAWEEARTRFPAKFDKNYNMVPSPEETAAWHRLQALDPPEARTIDQEVQTARRAGPEGSPERAQALKDLVARYGGDPDLIDPLLAIRGADASESSWAIKENILAAHARKQGYDGVVTVQPRMPSLADVVKDPRFQEARQAFEQAQAEYQRLDRYGVLPNDPNVKAAAQRSSDAYLEMQRVQEQVRQDLSSGEITELADVREGANPTPSTAGAAWRAAQAKVDEIAPRLEAAGKAIDAADETGDPNAWREPMRAWRRVKQEFDAAVDAREALRDSTPEYTLRDDVRRREVPPAATTVPGAQNAALSFDPSGAAMGGAAGALSPDEEGEQGDPLRTGAGMAVAGVARGILGRRGAVKVPPGSASPVNAQRLASAIQRAAARGAPAYMPGQVPGLPAPPPNAPVTWWDRVQAWRMSVGLFGQISTALLQGGGGFAEVALGGPAELIRQGIIRGHPEHLPLIIGEAIKSVPGAAASAGRTMAGKVPQTILNSSDYRPPVSARETNRGAAAAMNVVEAPGRIATQAPDAFWYEVFYRTGLAQAAAEAAQEQLGSGRSLIGAGVGAVTGGAAGAATAPEDATLSERAARGLVGAITLGATGRGVANLTGRSFALQKQLIANPTPEIIKRAHELAQSSTYKGDLGLIGTAGEIMVKGPPKEMLKNLPPSIQRAGTVYREIMSHFMPVYHTIARIHEGSAEYTPGLGLLPLNKIGLSATSRGMDTRIAQQAVGLAYVGAALTYAASGGIRGPGHPDPDVNAEMRDMGRENNTTNVGGFWVPNSAFGKFGPILNEIGAINDAMTYGTGKEKLEDVNLRKKIDVITKNMAKAFSDYPTANAFAAIAKLGNDPVAALSELAADTASQYSPAAIRAATMSQDPKVRRPDRSDDAGPVEIASDRFMQRSGINRQSLPAAQDRLGREVENPRQGWSVLFPRVGRDKTDPVIQAFVDNNIEIPKKREKVTIDGLEIPLTPPLQRKWQTYMGEFLLKEVPKTTRSAFWNRPTTTIGARGDELRDLAAEAAEEATGRLEREIPNLKQLMLEAERKEAKRRGEPVPAGR